MDKIEHSTIAYTLHGNCYLNITSRCTLKCAFCPKYNRTWVVQEYDLRLQHEPDLEEVLTAIGDPARYHEIVFCGLGEPTLRLPLLLEVAAVMKRAGAVVRVNTDGLVNLVEGRDVTPEMARVVDKLSISLTADSEEIYNLHTRPTLPGAYAAMQAFAQRAQAAGMEVTLSAIDGLEGVNIDQCEAIATRLGVKFRRRILDNLG